MQYGQARERGAGADAAQPRRPGGGAHRLAGHAARDGVADVQPLLVGRCLRTHVHILPVWEQAGAAVGCSGCAGGREGLMHSWW